MDSDSGLMDSDSDSDSGLVDSDSLPDSRVRTHSNTVIKYQKKYSGAMDFYALKLRSTSKNLLENIRSRMLDVRDIRWPRNEYEQGLRF